MEATQARSENAFDFETFKTKVRISDMEALEYAQAALQQKGLDESMQAQWLVRRSQQLMMFDHYNEAIEDLWKAHALFKEDKQLSNMAVAGCCMEIV